MWRVYVLAILATLLPVVHALLPSTTNSHVPRNSPPNASFVTAVGQNFFVDGQPFNFIGTDAYWLPMLNSTENVRKVLQSIKDTNLSVVRVWGFNDVTEVPPDNSTYFQLFQNGTATINNGTTGLQRLDTVIDVAGELGLKILLTTTNNWNPVNSTDTTPLVNGTAPSFNFSHGFLSNDYGGMDLYVSHFRGSSGTHDEFYTNETIKNAYKAYLSVLISRYADNPTVFGWEIANDPRCNSSIPASPSCTTTTVTLWHQEIAQKITQLDPNHLVASGAQGFQCMEDLAFCPKHFPLNPSVPPPQVSGTPGKRKRNIQFNSQTVRQIMTETRKRRPVDTASKHHEGKQIRGRWIASPTKRQAPINPETSSLDGSFGVDSQDILNIPEIGFSSFQLFPDQNTYGPSDPNLNASQNALEIGVNWIITQSVAAQQVGKPSILTAFGLVSQNNSAFFVPFNSSQLLNNTSGTTPVKRDLISGLSDEDQSNIYAQWVATAIENGINGVLQYQWSQTNLNPTGGGGVVTEVSDQTSTTAPNGNSGGIVTPNDGYGAQTGTGPGTLINSILNQALALQDARSGFR